MPQKHESFDEYAKMRRQFEESAAYQKHQQDYQTANKPLDLVSNHILPLTLFWIHSTIQLVALTTKTKKKANLAGTLSLFIHARKRDLLQSNAISALVSTQ